MSMIAFRLNGALRTLPAETSPLGTLLDWLRGAAALTGTKEGCAEGDCGACTVVMERADGGRVAVNACLLTLGQAHGRALRTVEGLRDAGGCPHPVQELLASGNATQCGFCTPGIVMTAWAHAVEGGDPHEALAGNLCRCTGYKPILDVFRNMPEECATPREAAAPAPGTLSGGSQVFHRPGSLAELVKSRTEHPGAWLLAGGTDLGLRLSRDREKPEAVICTLDVPELAVAEAAASGLRIGAAVPYRDLLALCRAERGFGEFAELLARLGSRQIRGMGTLGGNLGTASPIGDALPPLVALGASVRLAGPAGEREMPVEDFLVGYRRNALLRDGEVIRDVWIPRPPRDALLACEKLSRRHDQDIAAVGLSVLLGVEHGRIVTARVAHGGLGPKVARAPGAEAAMAGAAFERDTFERAAEALMAEVAPRTDQRATAAYRQVAAGNLLRRLWWRWSGQAAA